MRKQIDSFIIIISFIIELFLMIFFRYSRFLLNTMPIVITKMDLSKSKEACMGYIIACKILYIFYILCAVYVIIVYHKFKTNQRLNLKKNTFLLLLLCLCDFILYLFDIRAMIISSNAFKFVIICLITNLIVYIKYKKNNIDIK